MANVMALTFAIGATLTSAFHTTMNKSAQGLQQFNREISAVRAKNRELKSAFGNSAVAAQQYEEHIKNIRAAMNGSAQGLQRFSRVINAISAKQEVFQSAFKNGSISARQYVVQLNHVYRQMNEVIAAQDAYGTAIREKASMWKTLAVDSGKFYGMLSASQSVFSPLQGAIDTAMNFEAVMSKVKAITGASGEELAKMNAKARELGAATQFTATQTGEAMTYLGMAGWKTDQILAGIEPMLSLAAASGTDLARTADILSDDLTAFGLSADDAAHMADVFAYTTTNANTTVELMGETMKYAAPVASAFGATMEETAALTGLMANAGIKGSQAGTSLRAGFLRLAGPPKKAGKEMEALGINLSDAQREMEETKAILQGLGIEIDDSLPPQKKMVSIIKQLAENTSGLSKEQKLAALGTIFGTNASSGWLKVIDAGPEQLEKFTSALNNCDGKADELAKTMQDNAKGALTAMQSAFESVAISVGSAFLPQIKGASEEVSKVSAGFAKWAGENPELIATLGELTTGLTAGMLATRAIMVAQDLYNLVKASGITLAKSYNLYMAMQTAIQGRMSAGMKIMTSLQWAWNAALNANPIGVAIVAGMVFVGVLKYLYDHCTELRIAWDNWWQGMKTSYPTITGILEGIFSLLLAPYNLVCKLVDKFSELVGLSPAVTSTAEGMRAMRGDATGDQGATNLGDLKAFRSNAAGGIYGRGTFLTTFAENSGESAIPHTPTPRNIALLAKTNEIMGSPLGGNSYSIPISITVNGAADAGTARDISAEVEAAVRRALDDIANQKARVSYA